MKLWNSRPQLCLQALWKFDYSPTKMDCFSAWKKVKLRELIIKMTETIKCVENMKSWDWQNYKMTFCFNGVWSTDDKEPVGLWGWYECDNKLCFLCMKLGVIHYRGEICPQFLKGSKHSSTIWTIKSRTELLINKYVSTTSETVIFILNLSLSTVSSSINENKLETSDLEPLKVGISKNYQLNLQKKGRNK